MEFYSALLTLLNGMVTSFSMLYNSSIFLQRKIFTKKIKSLITIFLFSLCIVISYMVTNFFIKCVVILEILMILLKLMYKDSINKIWISSFFSWFILLISELLVSILITILHLNINEYYGTFFIGIIISLFSIIISKIKLVKNSITKIIFRFDKLNIKFLTFIINIIAISFSIIIYINTINVSKTALYVLSLLVIIIYTVISFILFEYFNKNTKMKENINIISENLREYEKMLDFQRVANHENKNELLVIKGKIKNKDEDVIKYIDNIIKDKRNDNEFFYNTTKLIPEGGLQGLIYYKSLLIKEKNINFDLNIDRKIRKYNLSSLKIDENRDLCKIIGVWIDNAIQATLKSENPQIMMQMYPDNECIIFEISNTFIGMIDLEKIDQIGYTTKGNGHGYGLSLVKEIIKRNNKFENKRSITGNIFKQILIIKQK